MIVKDTVRKRIDFSKPGRTARGLSIILAARQCFYVNAMYLRCSGPRFREIYVPVRYVCLTWQAVKAEAPQIAGVTDFKRYFETTWLAGSYPPSLWNVHNSVSTRTNNHIEGWHSKLKKVVGKAHPNVFEIV